MIIVVGTILLNITMSLLIMVIIISKSMILSVMIIVMFVLLSLNAKPQTPNSKP